MTLEPELLSQDWLFVTRPPPSDISLQQFYDSVNTDQVEVLIDKTFSVLKLPLTVADKLKAWEIRLLLQLFDNKLLQAKQEAINLNNLLYLQENNNVAPTNPGVYPLPRNNNGMIHHRLLVLLLRLKSIPNMNLINEFYKLCYQLRLRNSAHDVKDLSKKLVNLSFDTIVILLVNKHYPTLLNFVNSMIYEIKSNKLQDYNSLLGNIRLLRIVTKTLIFKSTGIDPENIITNIVTDHQQEYEEISSVCFDYLLYALAKESKDSGPIEPHLLTLPKLIQLILDGKISSTVLSSTVAIWDLVNSFGFILEESSLRPIHDPANDITVSCCLEHVSNRWCDNFDKLYGLQ